MKSYDEGGSSLLFLALLAAMVALACFNIWRKGPQAQPQSVLNANRGCCTNNVQWSLFIEKGKTMEQFFFTPRP